MENPCLAMKLGSLDCFVVIDDNLDASPGAKQTSLLGAESRLEPATGARSLGIPQASEHDAVTPAAVRRPGHDDEDTQPPSHWLNLTGDPGEEEMSLLHSGTPSWEPPMEPVRRESAGEDRCRARDDWNLQELRLGDVLARNEFDCSHGLTEHDLRVLLLEFWAVVELDEAEFAWVVRFAAPDERGRIYLRPLHYALRAQHGVQRLPSTAWRQLALVEVPHHGADAARLQVMLEALNGDKSVSQAEVQMVAAESQRLADVCGRAGAAGRPELLRAIGAWYTHVRRRGSDCRTLLLALGGRFSSRKEYHEEVLDMLVRFEPMRALAAEAYGRARRRWSVGPNGSVSAEACARLARVAWAASTVACLLGLLLLPSAFFGWVIFIGAEHGSDVCRYDLDGLLVWFGVLGFAALVLSCMDRSWDRASVVGAALKVVLLLFPWVGTSWTFQLDHEEQTRCGPVLCGVSAVVWPALLLLELLGMFSLCWGFAVLYEHESSLRDREPYDVLEEGS